MKLETLFERKEVCGDCQHYIEPYCYGANLMFDSDDNWCISPKAVACDNYKERKQCQKKRSTTRRSTRPRTR